MTIYALWCHPRSMSTAFERIMRERGDLDVIHEPFMYDYYLNGKNRVFADFAPEPNHPTTYPDIRDMILERSRTGPVFLKDMAYYVKEYLPQDTEFMRAITHAFLIRDPAESVLSYQKRDPEFVCEEVGIEAQWALFAALKEQDIPARIIQAHDVRANPEKALSRYCAVVGLPDKPEALRWDSTVPDGWDSVKEWHADAITSGEIRPPEHGRDYRAELSALGEPYTSYERHHRPFYDRLCRAAGY